MLIIQNTQLQALAQPPRQQFIDEMMNHLYSHFPTQAWRLTRDDLRSQVNSLIDRAASHQLTSRQQVCRFINLAATYGWAFDSDPNLLWMRNILSDNALPHPGERLNRLVESCLHRQKIEDRNLRQRRELGLLPSDKPVVFEPQVAADHSGPDSYQNAQPERLDRQKQIKSNPSDYRLSESLLSDEEFFIGD